MTREEFFSRVDLLLGAQAPGRTQGWGRWRRGEGGGRYPGRGLIRYHTDEFIHLLLYDPDLKGTFTSPESALAEITSRVDSASI